MKKFKFAVLALAFAVLGGCANMGAMVGTSASVDANGLYKVEAVPQQQWTNGD